MEPIVNRVAESDIQVFNLEELWDGAPVREFDLAPLLDDGLILRERAFREAVKRYDWEAYRDCHVGIHCSTDAIIPTWAYMLIATRLKNVARSVEEGRAKDAIRAHFTRAMTLVDWKAYEGRNVVVKGCGSKVVPTSAYIDATLRLQEVATKVMFGEPCSSVPLWRRPNADTNEPRAAVRPVALGKMPPR
ncbi:MAG: DUF2480 family protein [Rhodothermales bacterium]